jgi:phage terminase large subunit-like protein
MRSKDYAIAVVNGDILACNWVILACKRHLNDLEKAKTKDFNYYFSEEDAKRYSDFIELLYLWKGEWAGKPLKLEGWQIFIVQVLLGWKQKDTNIRRFKKAYIEMGRKNAKTTLAACIALAVLYIDGEKGSQVYSAATKEEQAKIVINDAAQIIKSTPELSDQFLFRKSKEGYSRIIYEDTASFMRPLGRDSDTQDGFDPSMGIIDEYHEHSTDGLVNVIESGMGARREPLLIIITTAGFDRTKPCYDFRSNMIEVLQGHRTDESLFGIIYTLDDGDDWTDSSLWLKSNPNLNVSVKEDFLKQQCLDAQNRGSKRGAFLTKNMNVWVDSVDTWISEERWNECQRDFTLEDLKGLDCYAGLDLASTADINSLSLYFPDAINDSDCLINVFFSPKDTANRRQKDDKVPYLDWGKLGWMVLTDGGAGKATDYNYIKKFILDLSKNVNLKMVSFDKWNASYLVNELINEGINMDSYSQSFASMSFPTKEFEKKILESKLVHNGNPCMAWMLRNVQLSTDSNDNVKIDKKKSTEKVDGPVSTIMALGGYIKANFQPEQEEPFFAY